MPPSEYVASFNPLLVNLPGLRPPDEAGPEGYL